VSEAGSAIEAKAGKGAARRGPGNWWADCRLPAIRHEAHFGDRVVRCFVERARSFHDLFAATVAAHPDREALVCGSLRLDWRGLDERVARVAGGLAARGIEAGDRVALFVSNRPEFVIALFAIQRIGAIAVPIGAREQRDGLRWILGHCGARAVFHDAELAGRLPAAAELPMLALRVACPPPESPAGGAPQPSVPPEGAPQERPGEPSLAFSELETASPLREAAAVEEEAAAVILYTSGTTGRPKGAMLTHLNVVHSAAHFVTCMGIAAEDRSLLAVPASHVTGLIANIASFVAAGGALVVMPAFKAAEFLVLAARERISHTLMVPAMYNLALLQPDFGIHDLSAWRIGGYGGAPMPVATIDALAARLPGLTLLNAYGATETTSPTTMIPAGLTRDHADSVGVALPCADVIAVDDDGRELPPGEVGELWIAGPMVVRGYWNDEAATAREFTAGWWHSGDLGSVDAEGFVRVFDRKKDMLNRGGYKIFSVEVENLIAAMPGVVEAAVVGRPCPVLGERVHAFVHATDPAVDAEAIRAFCAERLADYKVPETVTITAEPLPRNPNGKLLKRVLREKL
jgi:O-succinylbenzoic acid--CoA ligase